jgi:cytochrome c oxidase subunit 2
MKLLLSAATANAVQVDHLLWALLWMSLAVLALVVLLMMRYIIKYRAGSPLDRGKVAKKTWGIETAWTAATLLIFFGLFVWGARLYLQESQPPANALKIYVVGKRWMWKVEHPGGQREINTLHVPLGQPVELVMTSEDVIHDFAVPAFRIKHDVLPDRYETIWFTPNEVGRFNLFCTQYCGLDHSKMLGEVDVLPRAGYQAWLAQNGGSGTLAQDGEVLFMRFGCSGCHGGNGVGGAQADSAVRAPPLRGLYGGPVPLSDGSVVVADERYLHDSIVYPEAQIVAGYAPIMPSFQGQLSEEEILQLIDYIKSLAAVPPS